MSDPGAVRMGVSPTRGARAGHLALTSQRALDRPLANAAHAAELSVAVASDAATLVGAFQRAPARQLERPFFRRGSGGPALEVGPGTVHVALLLGSPGALEPCDAKRIVNRSVRPLLKALTKTTRLAHYFGRDWISVAHRPAAWVGFAHDSTSGRTLFEAFVAVRCPFASGERASFLGRAPATLEELTGRSLDPAAIAAAVVDAYAARYGAEALLDDGRWALEETAEQAVEDPPWAATIEEAIGTLGAGLDGDGRFRVGGDWLVSRDAVARLEEQVAGAAARDVGPIVDAVLGSPHVAIDGVASLANVRDVILRARM